MNLKNLKAYHAYYVMCILFLLSCFFFHDMVFFPLACCFLCLGAAKQLKEQGRLASPEKSGKSADPKA